MEHDIKIFETRDRMSALSYALANFNPIARANSTQNPPSYLLTKQLH